MARKKRADADVPRQIPPIFQKPQEQPQSEPMCLFCKHAEVKPLDLLHIPGKPIAVFCCQVCAASYALNHVKRRLLTWCGKHAQWSDDNGQCEQCWIETEAARRNGYIKAFPDQADAKGVDNVK